MTKPLGWVTVLAGTRLGTPGGVCRSLLNRPWLAGAADGWGKETGTNTGY